MVNAFCIMQCIYIRCYLILYIWAGVVFSGVSETLANHWLPTLSISSGVFYICCHWFYPSSVQHRRSCFLPYSSLQLSLLPGRTYSSCVLPQLFLFLFVNNAWSCVRWMILSAVCTCNFFQAIFLHMVRVLFAAFCACLSYSAGFPVVSIYIKHLRGGGTNCSTLSRQ